MANAKKKSIITAVACSAVLLVSAMTIAFVAASQRADADVLPAANYTTGPVLKTGRYYVDGDTDQYYLEVTATTISLKDVDYTEYALYGNDEQLYETNADFAAAIDAEAERLSQPMAYKTAVMGTGSTLIFTDWTEENGLITSGTGYKYIDENTIMGGDGETFIYVDADSAVAHSASDNITRKVDAVK